MLYFFFQISMSVTSTLMAVLTFVLTPLDPMCAAVDLDTGSQVIGTPVMVLAIMSNDDICNFIYHCHSEFRHH